MSFGVSCSLRSRQGGFIELVIGHWSLGELLRL
jgi:hypothetical protein